MAVKTQFTSTCPYGTHWHTHQASCTPLLLPTQSALRPGLADATAAVLPAYVPHMRHHASVLDTAAQQDTAKTKRGLRKKQHHELILLSVQQHQQDVMAHNPWDVGTRRPVTWHVAARQPPNPTCTIATTARQPASHLQAATNDKAVRTWTHTTKL